MWYLSRLAIRNRAITLLLALMLVGASIWAALQLKMELLPDFDLPIITVVTVYPDASPETVLTEVTEPVEGLISDKWLDDKLRRLYSTSSNQISIVLANFEYGTDMGEVEAYIRQGVSELDLPMAVTGLPMINPQMQENPSIVPLNLDLMPLVILSLSGDASPDQLATIMQSRIVPELESIEGVYLVEAEITQNDKVLIAPDPFRLTEAGISVAQIVDMLSLNPLYSSVDQIANVPLNGVVLEDVADVKTGPAPRTVITRANGQPSVSVSIMKEREANTVDVGRAVIAKAETIQSDLGSEFEVTPVFNQADFIERSIGELAQMALIGAVLATIIVFFFLKAIRISIVTAMSIPISVLAGLLAMKLSGITINLFTLSAMAIAVGRLIDNSIVVSEVIYRRLQQGHDFREAVTKGAKEVAGPITSSTLATVAIFVPLLFVGGIVGELFLPFALTITYALIASLFIALIVIPALSNQFVSRKEAESDSTSARGEAWYHKLYIPSLRWALGHRAITLVVTGALFLGSLGLLPVIGTSFIPGMSEKMLFIEIEMPPGTSLGETSSVASQVEDLLAGFETVETYYTTVGTSTSLVGAMTIAMGAGDNTAEIIVRLTEDSNMDEEKARLDNAVAEITNGAFVAVSTGDAAMTGGMGGSDVRVTISGSNVQDLSETAGMVYQRLSNIQGLDNIETSVQMVVPKLDISLAPAKLIELGLTEDQVTHLNMELMLLKSGSSLPGLSCDVNGEFLGIYVTEMAGALYAAPDPEALASQLKVGWPQTFDLGIIADVNLTPSLTHIQRVDQKLSATVTGTVTDRNVGAVNFLIEREIQDILSQPGTEEVEIRLGGVAEDMQETFSSMGRAILGAIGIALLILALTMRSVLNPIIIMVSLPLASIGAFLALLITGNTLGVSGLMGILMLVGIVLTNAIVLIALVEQLRKSGMRVNDALIEAGRTRLRPILMTASTTMIAMVPLAWGVGEGTIIAAELAVVVIGGLFTSTLLTLLVIPVIYSLIENLRRRSVRAS